MSRTGLLGVEGFVRKLFAEGIAKSGHERHGCCWRRTKGFLPLWLNALVLDREDARFIVMQTRIYSRIMRPPLEMPNGIIPRLRFDVASRAWSRVVRLWSRLSGTVIRRRIPEHARRHVQSCRCWLPVDRRVKECEMAMVKRREETMKSQKHPHARTFFELDVGTSSSLLHQQWQVIEWARGSARTGVQWQPLLLPETM